MSNNQTRAKRVFAKSAGLLCAAHPHGPGDCGNPIGEDRYGEDRYGDLVGDGTSRCGAGMGWYQCVSYRFPHMGLSPTRAAVPHTGMSLCTLGTLHGRITVRDRTCELRYDIRTR